MDRHEWGSIHLIIGYVLLGLLIIHIILHLKAITGVYNKIFKRKLMNKLISTLFISICVLFLIVPFFIHPTISQIEHGKGRLNGSYNNHGDTGITTPSEKIEIKDKEPLNRSSHSTLTFEIRGYMTLNDVSKKYSVPIEFIKTRLKIPTDISSETKLSWLRKKYNIRMNDVKEAISEYQNKIE